MLKKMFAKQLTNCIMHSSTLYTTHLFYVQGTYPLNLNEVNTASRELKTNLKVNGNCTELHYAEYEDNHSSNLPVDSSNVTTAARSFNM